MLEKAVPTGINTTQKGVDRWRERVPPLTEVQRAKIRRRRELLESRHSRDRKFGQTPQIENSVPCSKKYDSSMTRRITVSLPDDVAGYLDRHQNSSAVVADAVRARMARGESVEQTLRAVGYNLTEEGRAWARSVLRRPTAEQRAESRRYLEALEAGQLPEPR